LTSGVPQTELDVFLIDVDIFGMVRMRKVTEKGSHQP